MTPPDTTTPPRNVLGGGLLFVALMAPAFAASISLGALATALTGSLQPPWNYVLAVGSLVGALLWLALVGIRLVPRWAGWGSLALLIGSGALLQINEALAPVTLLAAVGAAAYLLRLPKVKGRPREFLSGTAALRRQAASGAAPGGEPVAPAPEIDDDTNLAVEQLPLPDPSRRPRNVAPVRVPLIDNGHRALFAVAFALTGLLAFTLLRAVVTGEGLEPEGTATRVVGGFFGVVFALFSLFMLYGAVVARPSFLVIDADGIRRVGGGAWAVPWHEVRAVGLRSLERVRPNDETPVPASVRRRRSTWLTLAPMGGDFPNRPELTRMRAWARPPWVLSERLTENPFTARSAKIQQVGDALATTVPDLYVGVLEV